LKGHGFSRAKKAINSCFEPAFSRRYAFARAGAQRLKPRALVALYGTPSPFAEKLDMASRSGRAGLQASVYAVYFFVSERALAREEVAFPGVSPGSRVRMTSAAG